MRVPFITAIASISYATAANAISPPRLIYEFPDNSTFIENLAVRPNGELVLTTFHDGHIYTINPFAYKSVPKLAVKVPELTGVTGISQIAPDVYAVAAGVVNVSEFKWEAGTGRVFKLDLSKPYITGKAVLEPVVTMPEAGLLNGMTSLPSYSHIILTVDSKTGVLYRINMDTGAAEVAFWSELFTISENPIEPLGANGIHVYGDYLYFTNSARGIFGRVKIDPLGNQVGDVEQVAQVSSSAPIDDFATGPDGSFYVTLHPESLVNIKPEGNVTVVTNGSSRTKLKGPTAVTFSNDKTKLYITTVEGQVVEFCLD
ncbi:unnamed protein product [Clonostachys chloroleuca]|uniref:SMP-30/Gluconolactonase/LRE-like region domain-containing protein n=1 Tax=Clonostachys chloroleuca TaxID=1926264 RepID=A0AA35LPP8_9HYPO|nr:unnamed protein product [Clonostachys chloroleuca]